MSEIEDLMSYIPETPQSNTFAITCRPVNGAAFDAEFDRLIKWANKVAGSVNKKYADNKLFKKNCKHQLNRLHIKLTNLVLEYQSISLQELRRKLLVIDSVSVLVFNEKHSLTDTLPYLEIDFRELSPGEALDQIFMIIPDYI